MLKNCCNVWCTSQWGFLETFWFDISLLFQVSGGFLSAARDAPCLRLFARFLTFTTFMKELWENCILGVMAWAGPGGLPESY